MTADSTQSALALRPRLAADPLWDFALALYDRPGVESACLRLQDEAGVDVCELLWHCWLYRHGLVSMTEPIAVRRWQGEVTIPLRRLRRCLKAASRRGEAVAELRATLLQAELQAEREALARLERLALDGPLHRLPEPPPGLARHLAERLQLQKKSHVLALQRLECSLDRSPSPR